MSDKGRVESPDTGGRLRRLRSLLEGHRIDAVLVTDIKNIRYLAGFTGSSAYLVVTVDTGYFITDSRYAGQAALEVKGFRIRQCRKALDLIKEIVASLKVKRLGFESNNLNYAAYLKVRKALKGVRLKPTPGLLTGLRAGKDRFEAQRIRDSARLLDSGYEKAEEFLRPGVAEKTAALEIETFLKRAGADAMAFDTIVASGLRSALPHGKASDKKIRKGELVVLDMGVCLNGYNSDETRTFGVGRPSLKLREIYDVVRGAQELAIEKVRPGVAAKEVDSAARARIEKKGYGGFFGHGTGHGVGLDVHEAPTIGPASRETLEEGMVITVEPGIYVPGLGGARIEDMALVVRGGCEILTRTPKDFLCL
ncbi:MAG: aminopeptidase P family protein [Deltaproteobacteria bacterium]|nr:aminopeptidase P family protein [Deltaproteobacteria bacterium]